MKKIAVFVSGSGTDLQSIIEAVNNGKLKVIIELVVASKPKIFAISRAENAGIDVKVYAKSEYIDAETMYEEIIEELKVRKVDYIVLAGYLNILTKNIIKAFKDRIINIHPALLPKFGGKGYYGLKVHEAVIQAKEIKSGATVHFVDEGTDTGKIIAQAEVDVYIDDTAESLQKRVLELEHTLLPETLAKLLNE